MRSVGAAVVLVLMVLRTAVQSETTTETAIETTAPRTCPDMSGCTGNCQPDYSYLYDGCPVCLCVDPICGWLVQCGPYEDCVLDYEAFLGAVCVPKYETTSETIETTSPRDCPDLSGCTGNYCSPDYWNLVDGCPTCLCVDPICGWLVQCGPDEDCVLTNKPPSYAVCVGKYETTTATTTGTRPTRETTIETTTQTTTETTTPTTTVTTPDPCTGTPNTNRCTGSSILRWTYNSVTDKCKKFSYYGCTPSFNTFSSKKACRNSCKVCKTLDCEDNCYASTKKNGCMKCICPCKGFKCPKGYECRVQEAEGGDKEPQPVCYPKPCPTQPSCNIKCMYGLKTDKNGCQLCECLKKPPPQK